MEAQIIPLAIIGVTALGYGYSLMTRKNKTNKSVNKEKNISKDRKLFKFPNITYDYVFTYLKTLPNGRSELRATLRKVSKNIYNEIKDTTRVKDYEEFIKTEKMNRKENYTMARKALKEINKKIRKKFNSHISSNVYRRLRKHRNSRKNTSNSTRRSTRRISRKRSNTRKRKIDELFGF